MFNKTPPHLGEGYPHWAKLCLREGKHWQTPLTQAKAISLSLDWARVKPGDPHLGKGVAALAWARVDLPRFGKGVLVGARHRPGEASPRQHSLWPVASYWQKKKGKAKKEREKINKL